MKKKIVLSVSTLLCLIVALTSCFGATASFTSFVQKDSYKAPPAAATMITQADIDGNYSSATNELVLFTKTENLLTTYTVYNIETGSKVWTGSESTNTNTNETTSTKYSVNFVSQWDNTWFYVTATKTTVTSTDTDTDVSYTLYTANGNQFAYMSGDEAKAPTYDRNTDLINFDKKVYRINDAGTVSLAFELSAFKSIPDVDYKAGNYYIAEADDTYTFYDANLNFVSNYSLPSYVDAEAFILSNGNVLVQYTVEVDQFSDDYTFIDDEVKYELTTLLVNAKNGKTTKLNYDYVIEECYAAKEVSEALGLNEKIDNVAVLYRIEDQRINTSVVSTTMASIGNNGKISKIFGDYIDGMLPGMQPVANNRWKVMNTAEQTFVLDENGKVVGESTNIDKYNSFYFVIDNKVYDWNFNLVVDLTSQKPTDITFMNSSIRYTNEDGEIKLYTNGSTQTIVAEDSKKAISYTYGSLLYVVSDSSGDKTTYSVYNYAGNMLRSFTGYSSFSVVASYEGAMILKVTNDGETNHFIVK